MMNEIRNVHQAVKPTETLFVVDAMTGQDAVDPRLLPLTTSLQIITE